MTVLKLIWTGLCTIIGTAAFVTFLVLQNYPASIWGFVAGSINGVSTHMHWLDYKNKLDTWYTRNELNQLMSVGFSFFTIGTMGFVYHLVVEIMTGTPVLPVDKSIVLAIIWAFITLKSGAMLLFYAYTYKNRNSESLLTGDESATAVNSTG